MSITDVIVYLLVVMTPIICSALLNYNITWNNRYLFHGKKAYILIAFITLWGIMAFRSVDVGVDTYNYAVNIYQNGLNNMVFDELFDGYKESSKAPLYWTFFWLISQISSNPQLYIFTASFIIIIGMASFILRAKVNVVLAIIVFVLSLLYFQAFNISRQFISIVLCLNSFLFLNESRTNIYGWILFLMAVSVHVISVVFIVAIVFMMFSKIIKLKWLVIISFITVLSSCMLFYVALESVVGNYLELYSGYLSSDSGVGFYNSLKNSSGFAVIGQTAVYFSVGLLYVYIISQYNLGYQNTLGYAILPSTLFFSSFWFLFRDVQLIERVIMPFQALQIVFIPYVLELVPLKNRLILFYVIFIGLLVYSLLMLSRGQMKIFPYSIGIF